MLRGSLLLVAVLALLGSSAGQSRSNPLRPQNGRIAYVHAGGGGRIQIYAMTATGRQRRQLTASRGYNSFDPAYAPDGKRIAFFHAEFQPDLWTMNADGTHKRRLTFTAGRDEIDPAWSPDGKHLTFAVDEPPGRGIWIMRADGKRRVRLTNGADTQPAWSPDGSEIAFQRHDAVTATNSILVVPASGGTPTTLSSESGVSDLEPAWSPDGSRILFSSDRPDSTQLDLWVMNADGSGVDRVTDTPNGDEHDPAWSPDGRRIVYSAQASSSSQIYVSNADGSSRRMLTHACGRCGWVNDDPSWQPLR